MSQLSYIKAQITSIKSISKITKAMELVSIAKLKRISKNLQSTKIYSSEVYGIFNQIIKHATDSSYLAPKDFKEKKTLWIVINSSIGLCGGYNLNVNKLIMNNIKDGDEIISVGTKAKTFFTNRKINIIDEIDVNMNFTNEDSKKYAFIIHDNFVSKAFDSIKIVYTSFINSLNFEPRILDLLPIVKNKEDKNNVNNDESKKIEPIVEFEPSVDDILEGTIILYLNTILYSAILESQVSEYTSRRIAMENATNNAKDLQEKLNLIYNRKRQDGITQEITEIVSGSDSQK